VIFLWSINKMVRFESGWFGRTSEVDVYSLYLIYSVDKLRRFYSFNTPCFGWVLSTFMKSF
jgi:hypothetical protein